MKVDFPYTRHTLDNGLTVILSKQTDVSFVVTNILYKVGSSYETGRKTGLAHLFEHLMFEGSQNVKKGEYLKYVQDHGGSGNANTSLDKTIYHSKLPSNFLELPLWLESDRMGFLKPGLTEENLANQKDVVKNERLERYDNAPYGLAREIIHSHIYPKGHPYSWPSIGYMEDIASYTVEDAINFHNDFYDPSNASLVIAGAFDEKAALALVKKYFDSLPTHGKAIQHPSLQEFGPKENELIVYEDNVSFEKVYLVWKGYCYSDKNNNVNSFLSMVLNRSRTSRLNKRLVHDKQIAQDVSCASPGNKLGGYFLISATARAGFKAEDLIPEIFQELERASIKNTITEDEIKATRNAVKSNYIYSSEFVEIIADMLNNYNYFYNEPNYFAQDLENFNRVLPFEIENAAKQLINSPYFTLIIKPRK